jgi:uncharacterized protein
MKKIYITLIFLLVSLLVTTSGTAASSGHIGLLTVSESSLNSSDSSVEKGGIADLYLVVKQGSGRIFIDSFPLSKIDTQITMRFATEIACDLLEKDCSDYDFFYTITANSAIVGGPSAGAAATVLTVALLDNQELSNDTIMTGTINSGNLIGPVAGVPAKALAAQVNGYTRVLIPEWDIANNTPQNLSISVIPISTLEEALYYFTGKNYSIGDDVVIHSKEYSKIMREVTLDLCSKYGAIQDGVLILPNLTSYDINLTNESQDNFKLAINAINNGSYYSAASFCFGGNVRITSALFKNLTNNQLKILYAQQLENVSTFERNFDSKSNKLSTISELETYMIVAERLYDTKQVLSKQDLNNISSSDLAYARERFSTAIVWEKFSTIPGQKFVMDQDLLKIACSKKLSEAEERINYMELYFPKKDIREELSKAYNYYYQKEYALCIFTASKVKAQSGIVLSAIFVPEDNMQKLLEEKISAGKRAISKQESANIFPILGYSYYEYANTLKNTDQYSSLLYAEYSLELSNLDMYFKKRPPVQIIDTTNINYVYVFAIGAIAGIIFTTIVFVIFKLISNYIKNSSVKKKINKKHKK